MTKEDEQGEWDNLGVYRNAGQEYRAWDWAETILDAAMLLALGFAVWVLYLVGWAW